jgi:hypothetical protein
MTRPGGRWGDDEPPAWSWREPPLWAVLVLGVAIGVAVMVVVAALTS